jgi:hypothetical protein
MFGDGGVVVVVEGVELGRKASSQTWWTLLDSEQQPHDHSKQPFRVSNPPSHHLDTQDSPTQMIELSSHVRQHKLLRSSWQDETIHEKHGSAMSLE